MVRLLYVTRGITFDPAWVGVAMEIRYSPGSTLRMIGYDTQGHVTRPPYFTGNLVAISTCAPTSLFTQCSMETELNTCTFLIDIP